jgi:(2R)-ethylmalonyl-CoA mutase
VLGGIIPESDRDDLLANGVTAIYTPKDFDIARIMRDIAQIAATYRKSQQ